VSLRLFPEKFSGKIFEMIFRPEKNSGFFCVLSCSVENIFAEKITLLLRHQSPVGDRKHYDAT